MVLFFEKGHNRFFVCTHGLIGYFIIQIRYTHLFCPLVYSLLDLFFQGLGHPHHAKEPAVTQQKLALGYVKLAMTHETGTGNSTTSRTCQSRELHAAWRHTAVIPVDRHNAVTSGQNRRNSLAATARGHGVIYNTIKIIVVYGLPGCLI